MTKVSLVNLTVEQTSLISFALLHRSSKCLELAEILPECNAKDSYLHESDVCRALWNDLEKHIRYSYDETVTE
jgi:hypothetical protein